MNTYYSEDDDTREFAQVNAHGCAVATVIMLALGVAAIVGAIKLAYLIFSN